MTTPPDLTNDEAMRLKSLRDLQLVETPIEERFERLTRLLQGLLKTDIAAISLVEADRQYFKSIQGLEVCGTSRDVSFCGHTILTENMVIVTDAREDDRFATNPLVTGPPNIVAYAAVPLHSPDGFRVGSLCAIHSDVKQFTDEELQHIRDIGALAESELRVSAANAVQAALVEEISVEQRKAMIDSLTRLWNRDGITSFASEALDQLANAKTGAAALMIDLDEFKPINDTHGHAVGDAVLRACGRRILSGLRETDSVGRVGGDEFLCILTDCESLKAAQHVAERVCARVCAEPVQTEAGPVEITVSIGIGYARAGWQGTLEELVNTADLAMYECKRCGRNGVRTVSGSVRAA